MFVGIRTDLKKFADYRQLIENNLYEQVEMLSRQLAGKRVLHINSTSTRGGVAEILKSSVPLLKDLSLKTHWLSLESLPPDIYQLTKKIHNGLQGSLVELTKSERKLFENYIKHLSTVLNASGWDYIFVHDHQLVAILSYLKRRKGAIWIWRSHTDTSRPNPAYEQQISEYLKPYDAAIFTTREFILNKSGVPYISVSAPAIDPFSPKNSTLSSHAASKALIKFGVDINKPLITQVSRLDPWNDLPGVIAAWKLAAQQIAGLQLAIVANYSKHDDQAKIILAKLQKAAQGYKDIFLILNTAGPRSIKAFQTNSAVSLQKSTREGFGLTVTEALWSKTPVVGGDVGGIRLQIINGKNGYLVSNQNDCAERIVEIVSQPDKQQRMGDYGYEHVRRNFLMPRLIKDELQLMVNLRS